MSEPGIAFSKNAPFLPNGAVYERILLRGEGEPAFGADDLFAAFKVKSLADQIGFGRQATQASRRQSRFLFYYVIMRMLNNVILLTPELGKPAVNPHDLTEAVLKLSAPGNEEQLELLASGAVTLIDQYLTPGSSQNSAFNEKPFIEVHNGDLNAFLKAENLGRANHSPELGQSLAITNSAFNMSGGRAKVANGLVAANGQATD